MYCLLLQNIRLTTCWNNVISFKKDRHTCIFCFYFIPNCLLYFLYYLRTVILWDQWKGVRVSTKFQQMGNNGLWNVHERGKHKCRVLWLEMLKRGLFLCTRAGHANLMFNFLLIENQTELLTSKLVSFYSYVSWCCLFFVSINSTNQKRQLT